MKISRFGAVLVAGVVLVLPAAAQPGAEKPSKGPVSPTPPTSPPAAAGKIDLRPKFKKGQEVRFRVDTTTSGKTVGGGAGDNTKQEMGATILLRCKDTNPETGSTLELVYESLKLSLKGGPMDVDFDSTKPAKGDDPVGEMLKPIVGTTIALKMDKDGNITEVNAGGGGGGAADQFTGADVIKNMFGPLFTTKKGTGEAAVGESWTNEDSMDAGLGKVQIKTTNTLKSVKGGTALIGIKGTFALDPSSTGKGVAIKDSSMNGECHWDTEGGMLETMTMRQSLSVEQTKDKGAPVKSTHDMTMDVKRVRK